MREAQRNSQKDVIGLNFSMDFVLSLCRPKGTPCRITGVSGQNNFVVLSREFNDSSFYIKTSAAAASAKER